MITSENIQQYINFLHLKKYLLPANELLLEKWAALSDIEIRNNLDGLYQHWGFNAAIAKDYETEFLVSQKKQEAVVPVAVEMHQPLEKNDIPTKLHTETVPEPTYGYDRKNKSGGSLKFITIACVLLLIIGLGAWYFISKNAANKEKVVLEQKVAAADQTANRERQIREERDKAIQQQASEKAAKINDFKTNRDNYIKQQVTYTYDGFWGGIKNVALRVTNNSDFKMNEVTVMLSYIKKNGDFFESKKVSVFNIPPHDSKTIAAPTSKRGVKVASKIISVQSDEIDGAGI